MDLSVLGCHGGESKRHRTSSFLVNERLAVDAGAVTSMLSLEEQRRIEAVLVSHSHMDHVRDLATMADNRCQQGGPTLEIAGTEGTIHALREHFFNNRLWPDFTKIETAGGPTVSFKTLGAEAPQEIAGHQVTAVMVDHTVETCGFVVEQGGSALAYSGDTGPTERLWQVLNAMPNLGALLMEVSFPNDQEELARVSGHHTPATLREEFKKLNHPAELAIMLYHIKPVFQAKVERELAAIKDRNLTILDLGDQFLI